MRDRNREVLKFNLNTRKINVNIEVIIVIWRPDMARKWSVPVLMNFFPYFL